MFRKSVGIYPYTFFIKKKKEEEFLLWKSKTMIIQHIQTMKIILLLIPYFSCHAFFRWVIFQIIISFSNNKIISYTLKASTC